ncbi:MAG: helix-turn-helix transcriptional regulator [Clostridia bacterium]|nr:helix-turn-helix transcriptional regulator [Clostridia bacterium]
MAERAGYSVNYYIKKFKAETGLSPMKYLTVSKIEKAKMLLETTDVPVLKIMEEVGFSDPSYFSRYFKKATGYSPRAFRAHFKPINSHVKE